MISEAFERKRRSHSGNVFEEVCFAAGEVLRPLAERRSAVEGDYEARLRLPTKGVVIVLYESESKPMRHYGSNEFPHTQLKCQRIEFGIWRMWFSYDFQGDECILDKIEDITTALDFKKAFLSCGVDAGACPDLAHLRNKLEEIGAEDLLLENDLAKLL